MMTSIHDSYGSLRKLNVKYRIDTHLGLRSDLDREGAAPVWWTETEETNGGSCARGGNGVIRRT